MYNIMKKLLVTKPYPEVRLVSNGKRAPKNHSSRRRKAPYSLRWNLLNSRILQKNWSEATFAEKDSFPDSKRSLPTYRTDIVHNVRNNCRYSAFKSNQNSSGKWCFSKDHWFQNLSLRQQSETLFEKSGPLCDPEHQPPTRSSETKDVLSPQTPHQPPVRFRFFGPHHLREIHRRGPSRLQSSQKGRAFLSSTSLLRVAHPRVLAWGLKTGKRLYLRWFSRFPECLLSQSSSLYLPHPSESRLRLLRSQIYPDLKSGREKDRLCHCGQIDQHHQKEIGRARLP